MDKVAAEDGKGPDEGPVVGMQLGRGHVNFCEERTLKPREWEAKLELLEDGGQVHEEKGFFKVCAIVDTHGLPFPARSNLHKPIMLPPDDVELFVGLAFFVRIHVLKGGNL